MKRQQRRKSKKLEYGLIFGAVSTIVALVVLVLAFQANWLSEKSLLVSKTQLETTSNTHYVLKDDFVFSPTNTKLITEELWCEVLEAGPDKTFSPVLQLLVDTFLNNDDFRIKDSRKAHLLSAFDRSFSKDGYSRQFVQPPNELERDDFDWAFSDPIEMRLHAIVRDETVYYHLVQDYDCRFEFNFAKGRLTDIKLYYWRFLQSVSFERFEKIQEAGKISRELLKRRDDLNARRDAAR